MAKYSSKDVVVEFDNAAGSLVNMSQHTLTINGVSIEALVQESHSFGDAWEEHWSTGIRKIGEIVLGGMYDDAAATGPDVIYNDVGNVSMAAGATRTFKITWGSTKTTSFETIIQKYDRNPERGAMTMYEVTLRPTGAATEA